MNQNRPQQLKLEGTKLPAAPRSAPRWPAPQFKVKARVRPTRRVATDRANTLGQSPVKAPLPLVSKEAASASDKFFSCKNPHSRLLQLLEEYRKDGRPELRLLTAAGARLSV